MSMLFFIIAILSIAFGIAYMIIITSNLSKREIKINYFLIRLYIIKYVYQDRNITIEESGKPGPLFYPFVVSMSLALFLPLWGSYLNTICDSLYFRLSSNLGKCIICGMAI